KLPHLNEPPRKGGYGIYYHFDYVGDPRNYKWLNTNQISRVWEQMHLAYEYNARQIWIVNVGDIKPMEFPISFFLDYAWNPEQWPAERLPEYTRQWAQQQFGEKHAKEIADILTDYTRFNSRRKPELLSPETYTLVNYREAETVVAEYNALCEKAKRISGALPSEYNDAFYQLVLHPVEACSNLNELYVTVARNRLYAKQGRTMTNSLTQKAGELYVRDSAITYYYNTVLAGGKWSHMMDQTHIGYTYWQQPDKNAMPEVKEIEVPATAEMGVAIEGSEGWWPRDSVEAVLPEFDVYTQQSHYIELFNRGKTSFSYSVKVGKPWVRIDSPSGKIETEKRLYVSMEWKNVPSGQHRVPITVTGPNNRSIVVHAIINNPTSPKRNEVTGFVEGNGCVSMEAAHYTRAVSSAPVSWQTIPNLGRTLSAVMAIPVTAPIQTPGGESPHLEYRMHLSNTGEVKVHAYLSPTLTFHNSDLRFAVSFDNEDPQEVHLNVGRTRQNWEMCVANNITVEVSTHRVDKAGDHVLKFWMIDPGVVLQKLVVDTGGMKASYLGPPESFHQPIKQ
ncbi:MAG TPA: glycosyl hydrolase, partial [Bacteroidetes bacterium]|nr:glycosyl hydrolase [Bacteroidota bacterium]